MECLNEAKAVVPVIATHFGVEPDDIWGRSRPGPVAVARHATWWVMRRRTNATLAELGSVFGRDHSTISHGIKSFEARVQRDDNANDAIGSVMRELGMGQEAPGKTLARMRRELEVMQGRMGIMLETIGRLEARRDRSGSTNRERWSM